MFQLQKIAIVGSGAVGGFYGAMLARSLNTTCCNVHFLLRRDYEQVQKNGWQVLSPLGDFVLENVHAHNSTESIGECDLVIIATKSTTNEILPELLAPLIGKKTILLTLQNGLGSEEFLAHHFGGERVLGGKCFVCLNRIAPGVIKHIGHGVIQMGEFERPAEERTHAIAALFQKSGVRCDVCDDLKVVLWRKLVWNIPFNGLAIAAGGVSVGQILADEDLLALTEKLMREVVAIATTQGVQIDEKFIKHQIERTYPMGEYKPSSLLDWQNGREVEVEAIWGEAWQRAQSTHVPAPHLESLLRLLRFLNRSVSMRK